MIDSNKNKSKKSRINQLIIQPCQIFFSLVDSRKKKKDVYSKRSVLKRIVFIIYYTQFIADLEQR